MSTAHLPRAATESEKYVIGCLVRFHDRPEVAAVFDRLTPSDFVDPEHRKIFSVAQRQFGDGGIDPVLIGRECGATQILVDLALDPSHAPATPVHLPAEAEKIVEASRKRRLLSIGEMMADAARNGQAAGDIFRTASADMADFRRACEAVASHRFTFADLRSQYPRLNPPVIDGLIREGETANIIANSKAGKSWLAYDLLLSVITGRPLFNQFPTTPGSCLLIDNELHMPTLANRIPAVANALQIQGEEYESFLDVWSLRGRMRSIDELADDLLQTEPGKYRLIVFDAKYRFLAKGVSENDNSAETNFYNLLDQVAEHTKAALILVHHSSKGSQSEKRPTDVGSGAGAQSRAADCHIVLREHETPGIVVMEAAVRSFAPVEPLTLEWRFPLWTPVAGLDPAALKGRGGKNDEQQKRRDAEAMEATLAALSAGPRSARQLRRVTGFGESRQDRIIGLLIQRGDIESTCEYGESEHEIYQLKR